MATSTQQTMDNVERNRLQLEENVSKLSKALEHWSAWETEYEMLKEELQKARSPSPSTMLEIGRSLGGIHVNEKEVEELLGKDLQQKRTANQVIDMISRRIDYVRQNRSTVEKQLGAAEKQLAGVSLLFDPGLENEEGLPMMDIEEELDENENVISSSVSQPGRVAPELLEVLQKAGLHKSDQDTADAAKDTPESLSSSAAQSSSSLLSSSATAGSAPSGTSNASTAQNAAQKSSIAKPKQNAKATTNGASAPKKSVSFAEDVEVETFENPSALKDDLKNWNLPPGQRVYELDENDAILGSAVVPQDEGLEDIRLRRDMLQYGLSEVNNVVAELDMDDDEDYDSEEQSEDEDEHGRSTRQYVTDDYRQQMMALEQKLNARMMENVGPRPELHALADNADDVRKLRVRKDEDFDEPKDVSDAKPESTSPKAKGVRFASDPDNSDPMDSTRPRPLTSSAAPTMSDTIVERPAPASQPPTAPSKPAKVSRFKSSRAAPDQSPTILPTPPVPGPTPVPSGPTGRTLANTVVEHNPQSSEPQAPDEFDPVLLNREIQSEYHKMRNKMIQRQGGFKETEEEKEDPLMEDRDGRPKKVSRFMAARLKADGL